MSESRRSLWWRAISGGLAAGLILLLTGDRTARGQAVTGGIDPLEILNLQVKPNVLFIVDTSSSMNQTISTGHDTGGDDPTSRFYQTKRATREVIRRNAGKANYGLATFHPLFDLHRIRSTSSSEGPLHYVSQDPGAADWAAPGFPGGFFNNPGNGLSDYDEPTSLDVFRSFHNTNSSGSRFHEPYPSLACTQAPAGATTHMLDVNCRYYIRSRMPRNNVRYTWNRALGSGGLVATTPIACPLPPAGLLGDDVDPTSDGTKPRACFQLENALTGAVATYFYTSTTFSPITPPNSCAQTGINIDLVPCSTVDTSQAVMDMMRLELQVDAAGNPIDIPFLTDLNDRRPQNPPGSGLYLNTGIRQGAGTPLGASLAWANTYYTGTVFPARPPAVAGLQKNYVILLTDGGESCGGNPEAQATTLYNLTPSPDNRVETFVIVFADPGSVGDANDIARAGSGGTRDAYPANNLDQLIDALNQVLDLASSQQSFSAAQPIIATVFELGGSPLDPRTRYNTRVNILYQSVFDLPGWDGHVYAFRNDGTFLPVPDPINFTNTWDAGETLFENISQVMETATRGTRPPNRFIFDELHDGATVDNIGATNALIKRRIFTSSRNGTFLRTTDPQFDSSNPQGRNVVALWPPNQTGLADTTIEVNPAAGTPGYFDDEMGIDTLTFGELQTQFGACVVTGDAGTGPLPPDCDFVADPTAALDRARKEARQVILAWLAGAEVVRGSDNGPFRDTTSRWMLYKDRGWIMEDSTLATLAAVTPPLRSTPNTHTREWVLFRDGRRDVNGRGINEIDQGFGLRNPDFDDPSPQTLTDLKPVRTVVYLGSNDGLHAFSADTSEELWAFVPYDQLGKLKEMLGGQRRDPHRYMIATSIRVADIFIPGTFTLGGITFDGRWRTVVFFGRGPGGKFYTALDVTAPGPYTRAALRTNPPFVMWNRGNGDGTGADFSGMGETWSVPAIGNVGGTPEWRAFTGSGYGLPNEGTTYYELDAITGDILLSRNVGDGTATFFPDNALVASPSAYNPFLQDNPTAAARSVDRVTRVYIPDIHGRIWKFNTSSGGLMRDEGPSQPFGNSVALLKIDNVPHIFANSGNDRRVTPPPAATPPFLLFGFKDMAGDGDLTTPFVLPSATTDFPIRIPNPFRGTTQPATAFNVDGKGRVFFAPTGQRTAGACLLGFDTLLFAVTAVEGGAAYDFTGDAAADLYTTLQDVRATGVQAVGGQVIVGDSGGLGRAPGPPPPPAPMPPPAPPTAAQVITQGVKFSSPVCRR